MAITPETILPKLPLLCIFSYYDFKLLIYFRVYFSLQIYKFSLYYTKLSGVFYTFKRLIRLKASFSQQKASMIVNTTLSSMHYNRLKIFI